MCPTDNLRNIQRHLDKENHKSVQEHSEVGGTVQRDSLADFNTVPHKSPYTMGKSPVQANPTEWNAGREP